MRCFCWLGDLPSVLWHCWLGDRKGIQPVENWVVGCWSGCLSGARCRLAYGPAYATATLSLASVKSRLLLPFWYRLTRVVPDKGPLNRSVCVCGWCYKLVKLDSLSLYWNCGSECYSSKDKQATQKLLLETVATENKKVDFLYCEYSNSTCCMLERGCCKSVCFLWIIAADWYQRTI